MEMSYVDPGAIETLEHYAVALTLGLMSMQTLAQFHVSAVDKGILADDMIQRTKVILWDIMRTGEQYKDQLRAVLELLPEDFNAESVMEEFKRKEIERAKHLTRKAKKNER